MTDIQVARFPDDLDAVRAIDYIRSESELFRFLTLFVSVMRQVKGKTSCDRASPNLMSYCLTGKRVPNVVLTMRKAGGRPVDFLRITMRDVIVTAVEMSSSYEKVRLSFASVKQEYLMQNAQGGSSGVVTGTFDIRQNAPER